MDLAKTFTPECFVAWEYDPGIPLGRLLWFDHTFALVKRFEYDKPVVLYLSELVVFIDGGQFD